MEKLSGTTYKVIIKREIIDEAMSITKHFPKGRSVKLAEGLHGMLELVLDHPEPDDPNSFIVTMEDRALTILRGISYVGKLAKDCAEDDRIEVAKRIGQKFPKRKKPKNHFELLQLMFNCAGDVLAAIYESAIYIVLKRTKGFNPTFRSDNTSGGCDIEITHARIIVECLDMQSENMSWPVSDKDCEAMASRIGGKEVQVAKAMQDSTWRHVIFLDVEDAFYENVCLHGKKVNDEMWPKVFKKAKAPGCVVLSNLRLSNHKTTPSKEFVSPPQIAFFMPGMIDRDGNDARPGFMQDLYGQLAGALGSEWQGNQIELP